ncbi:hypothetical protein [Paenibacillus apiarius]|uniref:hypothetical protein n=1 Tax=Paenibacillus apiarius TaxID=46240 RepID=UPI001981B933|nr:hypothetical protein [Paenibacillus apiarius]MBN3522459.1 hypothetical protein [Paenibacillus apiarius]
MRKFITVSLILILLLSLPIAAGADTYKFDDSKIDSYLLESGYPQEVINVLQGSFKEALYRDRATFLTLEKATAYLSDDSNKINLSENELMALSNFTQYLIVSRIGTTVPGTARFSIVHNWMWDYAPRFVLKDKTGIAWSSDFNADPESAFYSYTATDKGTGTRYDITRYTYDKYTPGAGIGWEFQLQNIVSNGKNNYFANKHSGGSYVIVTKSHDGSGKSETSSASAKYFHKEKNVSGSLSFSKGSKPEITISPSDAYDESPDKGALWYWKQQDE